MARVFVNEMAEFGPCSVVCVVAKSDRVEESYERLHPRLWHALVAYTGSEDMASDAEAEAFTQALRRGSELVDIDAWVWRSSFRIAGGLLKERRRISRLVRPPPAAKILDSKAEFIDQLARLSEQQRRIVILRYIGLFRATEIADVLGTTPGTVRVQLHRAHENLRLTMEEDL